MKTTKISIYELLGLIKKGEAPKKIIYKDKVYELCERLDGIFNYKCIETNKYFTDEWFIENILNELVEIIEEEKEIEKLPLDEFYLTEAQQKEIIKKINELIDVINEMRDKE